MEEKREIIQRKIYDEDGKTDPVRIKRDKIVENMFRDNIKLIRQDVQKKYNQEDLINKIISK